LAFSGVICQVFKPGTVSLAIHNANLPRFFGRSEIVKEEARWAQRQAVRAYS
jgi:hypothetical protein